MSPTKHSVASNLHLLQLRKPLFYFFSTVLIDRVFAMPVACCPIKQTNFPKIYVKIFSLVAMCMWLPFPIDFCFASSAWFKSAAGIVLVHRGSYILDIGVVLHAPWSHILKQGTRVSVTIIRSTSTQNVCL